MKKLTAAPLYNIKRRLKARNARFKALTKAQQRVAIAKDVIAQLEAKTIVAGADYLDSSLVPVWRSESASNPDNSDLGVVFSRGKCHVCALGGMFVAAVQFKDKITQGQFRDAVEEAANDRQAAMHGYLKQWFTINQLELIEAYFEGYCSKLSPISVFNRENQRMIMIMENIISNKGKFNPHKGMHSFTETNID